MSELQKTFQNNCKEKDSWNNWLFTEICHKYQVTTCYRKYSCDSPSWFYETFIWESNKGAERDLIGDATFCRKTHFEVCEWIIKNGWDKEKFNQWLENDN